MPLFADLDRLRADLDTLRPLAPEQEARVLQKFRLEWNYNSNAIEGNSLTLGETRSLLLHGLTAAGKPMRDHLDIKGHNEAVLWLEDFVRAQEPLTEYFIRGMHEALLGEAYEVKAQTPDGQPTTKLIVPGRYKTSPNNVKTATGEMFYFASVEETPAKMSDLIDWYRAEEAAPTLHPVARATEFHYRFVRIHPFDDGNGRMSRLLMNLILLRHGYPMTVIQAADRNRYLAALAEADAGEPEPFLRFIIENVEAGLRLMIRAARGESIDEPSDLDKKLALLKKQVLMREDVLTMTWNAETQPLFRTALFEFWINDLAQELSRFNDLFLQSEISFLYKDVTGEGVPIYNSGETLPEAHILIEKAFTNEKETVRWAAIRFLWGGFRMLNNPFGQGIMVHFDFAQHQFTVEFKVYSSNPNEESFMPDFITLLSSIYKTEYDTTQIHEINYQLANKVYDFIAAKLAEADTPPA